VIPLQQPSIWRPNSLHMLSFLAKPSLLVNPPGPEPALGGPGRKNLGSLIKKIVLMLVLWEQWHVTMGKTCSSKGEHPRNTYNIW
jgi:hypothetical protein